MSLTTRTPPLIESLLLRKSLGALASSRSQCVHCHRTPLAGELVHLYATGSGAHGERRESTGTREVVVCELCRPLRREAPARSELVRSTERARSVRVRAPRAA